MGPELALAIVSCTEESASILVSIAKKVKDIVKLKERCLVLHEEAKVLHKLIQSRSSALQNIEAVQSFLACLQQIERFISDCKTYNMLQRCLEVLVRKQFPALRKQIAAARQLFIVEAVAEMNVLVQQQISDNTFQNEIDIEIDEKGVKWDSSEKDSGKVEACSTQCVLRKLHATISVKTNLERYQKIQYGAYVQNLFGITKIGAASFVVLEDLNPVQTLSKACENGSLSRDIQVRTLMAYKIAKSVAWLHKNEFILKSMSDQSIVIRRFPDGQEIPILTQIESLRHVLEKTTMFMNDSRYEAPEYALLRVHTPQTDIWSLGVIIWQCITGQMPFSISDPVLPLNQKSQEQIASIRKLLTDGELPGSFNASQIPADVRDVIISCWNRNSMLRPTAIAVADQLLNCIVKAEINASSSEVDGNGNPAGISSDNDLQSFYEMARHCITQARVSNEGRSTIKRAEQSIPSAMVRKIMQDNRSFNPVESFIVGAALFWNLLDEPLVFDEQVSIGHTGQDLNEKRLLQALVHLQDAVDGGYHEALQELYRAHAILSRTYLARLKTLRDAKFVP